MAGRKSVRDMEMERRMNMNMAVRVINVALWSVSYHQQSHIFVAITATIQI